MIIRSFKSSILRCYFACCGAALLSLLLTASALSAHAVMTAQATASTNSTFADVQTKANEARDSNRLDEAIPLYRKALALRPSWAEGWWSLGTLLYDRDSYAEAVSALRKAVALSPKTGVAVAMLGLCEAKLGYDRDALRHLDAAAALGVGGNPDLHRVMLYTKGTLLLNTGEFAKAQNTLNVLAKEGIHHEELILALGFSVLGIKPSSAEAADLTTREIVRRAGQAERLAASRSDLKAALRAYSDLAAYAPKFHNVQFAYGRFLLANHKDDKAVEAFKREIENTPNHLLARLGIAGIQQVRDPAAGLPYAEEAVKLAPSLVESHYLLGALLLATGNTKRAIQELEISRRLGPNEAKVYFALGRAYGAVNRKEEAARARDTFNRLKEQTENGPRERDHDWKQIP